jgi:hypothetical protein
MEKVPVPKGTMRLEKEMAIIVPSTKGVNKPITKIEMKKRISEVKNFMIPLFGGSTRLVGTGSYMSKKGLVDEPVAVMEVYADTPVWKEHQKEVIDFLVKKAKEWGQESVSFEFETDLFLIEPKKEKALRKVV